MKGVMQMALSVDVPKDLKAVKAKVALGLTKRQLICYPCGLLLGVPTYFLTKDIVGGTVAAMIMITLLLPFFLLAHFERDGKPAEIVLKETIEHKFLRPSFRPYRTENLYELAARREEIRREVEEIERRSRQRE